MIDITKYKNMINLNKYINMEDCGTLIKENSELSYIHRYEFQRLRTFDESLDESIYNFLSEVETLNKYLRFINPKTLILYTHTTKSGDWLILEFYLGDIDLEKTNPEMQLIYENHPRKTIYGDT